MYERNMKKKNTGKNSKRSFCSETPVNIHQTRPVLPAISNKVINEIFG